MDIPPRKTGLERPFHPFQIISWVLQLFNVLSFYFTTISCLAGTQRIFVTIIFTILQTIVLVLGYKLSSSDPTDEIVGIFRTTNDKAVALQLEEKNEKFCNFCRSPVDRTSKHCVRCNRCTNNFDHHCKWVNNCVGSKNYKIFVSLIVTCLCIEGFLLVLCLNIVMMCAEDSGEVKINIKDFYKLDFFTFFLTIQGILAVEGAIFSVLLGYLVGLHMYLAAKGLTTYEYILNKRQVNRVLPNKSGNSGEADKKSGAIHQHNISGSDLDLKLTSRV